MKYTNSKGETMEIEKMPDAYLLNAYLKQNKRLKEIKEKLESNPMLAVYISQEVNRIEQIVTAMRSEVERRQLV